MFKISDNGFVSATMHMAPLICLAKSQSVPFLKTLSDLGLGLNPYLPHRKQTLYHLSYCSGVWFQLFYQCWCLIKQLYLLYKRPPHRIASSSSANQTQPQTPNPHFSLQEVK